jgi:hypothetical protein
MDTETCSMDLDKQHRQGHRHATWTRTCTQNYKKMPSFRVITSQQNYAGTLIPECRNADKKLFQQR